MTTYVPKKGDVKPTWYVVNAADVVLGRLSTLVAKLLRGKHKPQFTPGMDVGDFVVVVNAARVKLTGNKWQDKRYFRHSGDPGHLKEARAWEVREKAPERLVKDAVWGMLPKNRLGRKLLGKLKVYAGPEHPHKAQQPQVIKVKA